MTATRGETSENRVLRAREQGGAAIDGLLASYRGYLRFLARDGVGAALQAKVDASDIAHDVLIEARERFDRFRGSTEAELLSWLRRILAHRIVEYARKYAGARRVAKERSIEDVLHRSSVAFESVMAVSGMSPSQNAARREAASRLSVALEKLKDDYQEVIRLRTMNGLSWDEVASRMGRSSGAVRMLWLRALEELRPLLEGNV